MDLDFSAKEPSLGYFYQLRYALFLLLSARQQENPVILIEALDDIEIRNNQQVNLHQTKYHANSKTNLSDRSSDFWKTLRVWCEQINTSLINPKETIFTLVTTESISEKSIIKKIKDKVNTQEIIEELKEVAKETTNKTNIKGYQAFNALNQENKNKLIDNMFITDSSLDFNEVDKRIKNELKLSALQSQIDPLLERLEGWFFRICIEHLQGSVDYISFNDLQKQINYIVDSFKEDNLPIDFPDKIQLTAEELEKIDSMIFSKQLDLIDISQRVKNAAISNYQRAFNQRSKWLKDDLLNPQEEIDFDKRLIDEWQEKFDLLLDATEGSDATVQQAQGKDFYISNYVQQTSNIFIRNRFQENYLTRGSYHMLSDKLKVGWHPCFEDLLKGNNNDS